MSQIIKSARNPTEKGSALKATKTTKKFKTESKLCQFVIGFILSTFQTEISFLSTFLHLPQSEGHTQRADHRRGPSVALPDGSGTTQHDPQCSASAPLSSSPTQQDFGTDLFTNEHARPWRLPAAAAAAAVAARYLRKRCRAPAWWLRSKAQQI
jgi:hypothetical protein